MIVAADPVVLSLDELTVAIHRTFDMESRQAAALKSRVKHMQKLGFPKPGAKKGFVAVYGAEDLLKVAIAFALLEAGMPSVRACALVDSIWGKLLGVMAVSNTDAVPDLIVRPHALATVGVRGLAGQEKAESVMIGTGDPDDEGARFSATMITVNVQKVIERIEIALTQNGATP